MDQTVKSEGQDSGAYRVGCDVGGTFTDLCFLDEQSGKLHVSKTPTTANPIDGVVKGIELGGIKLKDMVLFAHGTTLATNALITRRSPGHHGHDQMLQGRDRNPPRHPQRSVGHL